MSNKTFENKAYLMDNKIKDHTDCEKCMEDYIFKMKDNYHEFEIGLRTILSCLALAEKEGAVPELPKEWWSDTRSRHVQTQYTR